MHELPPPPVLAVSLGLEEQQPLAHQVLVEPDPAYTKWEPRGSHIVGSLGGLVAEGLPGKH